MVKVSDNAHDGKGNAVSNPFEVPAGKLPEEPRDDYEAANKAIWALARARAIQKDPGRKTEEDRHGRLGLWWEGNKASLVRELWPELDKKAHNAFVQSGHQYLYGNMDMLVRGRLDASGMYWVAYEWKYDARAASDRITGIVKARKAEKGQPAGDAMVVSYEEPVEIASEPVKLNAYVVPIPGPADVLRGVAEQIETLAKRERLLNQKKGEIKAYLLDVIKVVDEL